VLLEFDTLSTYNLKTTFQLILSDTCNIGLERILTAVGMIIIEYNFPCGVQSADHPNPGIFILKQLEH
jgi:hypothetical protein